MNIHMKITKMTEQIKVTFFNKSFEYSEYDKFNLFIKGIFNDMITKTVFPDIKKRLVAFFKDAKAALTQDYHQGTVDEYIEKLSGYQNKVLCNKLRKNNKR